MASRRAAVAVSAWFRLPAHMEKHEVLSRGSGFFVAGAQPIIIASAHVLQPWRFPQYFGEEWISHATRRRARFSRRRRA